MLDSNDLELEKQFKKKNIKTCQVYFDHDITFKYSRTDVFAEDLLPINSCTKSITGALVGICLEKGYFDHVRQPFLPLLNHETSAYINPGMKNITIHQLLTMTSGIDWDDRKEWHLLTETFDESVLDTILGKKITDNKKGEMTYSSADSYLLSALIQEISGMTVEAFAKEYLFDPLGIKEFHWPMKQGVNLGSHGMLMKADDLMKIGVLYLNGGVYNDQQIIPKSWIEKSTMTYSKAPMIQGGYGYHWWMMEEVITPIKTIEFYFAMGYGGQVLIVVPALKLVTVITRNIDSKTLRSIDLFKKSILLEYI